MSPAITQRLLPALLHLLLEKWPQPVKNPHFLPFISPELTNISWTPGKRFPANIKTELTLKDGFERDEGWSKHTHSNSLWWRSTLFSAGQTGRGCDKQKDFCPYSTFLLFIPSWTVSVGTLMCNSVSAIEKKKKNDIKKWAQKAWMKTRRGNHLQPSVLRSPLINARWLRNIRRLSVFYPEFLITAWWIYFFSIDFRVHSSQNRTQFYHWVLFYVIKCQVLLNFGITFALMPAGPHFSS